MNKSAPVQNGFVAPGINSQGSFTTPSQGDGAVIAGLSKLADVRKNDNAYYLKALAAEKKTTRLKESIIAEKEIIIEGQLEHINEITEEKNKYKALWEEEKSKTSSAPRKERKKALNQKIIFVKSKKN